jgi:hypothetical protein
VHWDGSTWSQSLSGAGYFEYVAASSARDVWAVGGTNWFSPSQTLAEHWNGSSWTQIRTPSPAGGGYLRAVAATSSKNVGAVGWTGLNSEGTGQRTLIEHWNGRTWTRVPSPNAGTTASYLDAVTVISSDNAWAVGSYVVGDTKLRGPATSGRSASGTRRDTRLRLDPHRPLGRGVLKLTAEHMTNAPGSATGPRSVW